MTHRPALAAAALLLAAAPLAAQPAPATRPDTGARVRLVLLDNHRVVGTLVAREPGRWLVARERGDTIAIVPREIDQLSVSQGRLSPARAFWRGAGIGALVGATVTVGGLGILAATGNLECEYDCFFPPVLVVGVLGTGLTIGTTLVGGIVGSFARDRWKQVPLPEGTRIGLAPTPDGAALTVQLGWPR